MKLFIFGGQVVTVELPETHQEYQQSSNGLW